MLYESIEGVEAHCIGMHEAEEVLYIPEKKFLRLPHVFMRKRSRDR